MAKLIHRLTSNPEKTYRAGAHEITKPHEAKNYFAAEVLDFLAPYFDLPFFLSATPLESTAPLIMW